MANGGIYKPKVKRDKGYSFSDGKLKLGKQEEVYGPQNDPNASPIDKAGLVDPQREKRLSRGGNWRMKTVLRLKFKGHKTKLSKILWIIRPIPRLHNNS